MSIEQQKDKVLIVDDAPEGIWPIVDLLEDNYEVLFATSGNRALECARAMAKPDLILLDVVMPGMDGYQVLAQLKADPWTSSIPVVFLTSRSNRSDEVHALDLGAEDYLVKPSTPPLVRAKVDSILLLRRELRRHERLVQQMQSVSSRLTAQSTASAAIGESPDVWEAGTTPGPEAVRGSGIRRDASPPPKILLVDDEPANLRVLVENLESEYEVLVAASSEEGLNIANAVRPDLILLDVMMPKMDGFEACGRLKANPVTQHIPVIFVSVAGEVEFESRGLYLGAIDYITKPYRLRSARARIDSALKQKSKLDERARLTQELSERNAVLEVRLHQKTLELSRVYEELRISEEKYRGICENALEGVFRVTPKGSVVEANSAMVSLLGYESRSSLFEETAKRGWDCYLPPDEAERLSGVFHGKSPQGSDGLQVWVRRKDGTQLCCNVTGRLIRERGQMPLFEGFCADITQRKQAEVHLKNSERRYRRLFETAQDFILTHDLTGRVLAANPYTADHLGLSAGELANTELGALVGPEHRGAFHSDYLEKLGRDEYREGTLVLCDRNGHELFIEYRSVVVKDEGELPYVSLYGRNVTEKVRAAQELDRMESKLRQAHKLEAIGTVAGGISHDFNNILGGIISYTEFASHLAADRPEIAEYLGQVMEAALRAKELIQQILTFCYQKPLGLRQPVDVRHAVAESLALLRASLPTTVAIRQVVTQQPAVVLSDATQLQQILMNLCTNAAHAIGDNVGTIGIEINLESVNEGHPAHKNGLGLGDYVCLTVMDNGQGMDASVRERIFEPYFTTKEMTEGTGLGLATVHGIVTSHGGSIDVTSSPGSGTTFKVYLPRALASSSHVRTRAESKPELATGSERILFVDDERLLRESWKRVLTHLGYQVDVKEHGAEALAAFLANPEAYDLVISDQTMPEMTGVKLAQEIRRSGSDVPIILCSGFSGSINPQGLKSAQVDMCLQKPLQGHELASSIRQALNQRRKRAPDEK